MKVSGDNQDTQKYPNLTLQVDELYFYKSVEKQWNNINTYTVMAS